MMEFPFFHCTPNSTQRLPSPSGSVVYLLQYLLEWYIVGSICNLIVAVWRRGGSVIVTVVVIVVVIIPRH